MTQLLNQPVAILAHSVDGGGTDGYGNPVPGWEVGTTAGGRVWQTDSTEVTEGSQSVISDFKAMLPAGTAVSSADRLRVGGQMFEVVGQPNVASAPFGSHHVELRLRSLP